MANRCVYCLVMKKDLHPTNYRAVVFQDLNNNTSFLTRSTVATDETIKWQDGNEYPLVKVHISSASHPFFTKATQFMDTEGRVDKFTKKYQRKTEQVKQTQVKQEEAKKAKPKAAAPKAAAAPEAAAKSAVKKKK